MSGLISYDGSLMDQLAWVDADVGLPPPNVATHRSVSRAVARSGLTSYMKGRVKAALSQVRPQQRLRDMVAMVAVRSVLRS